MNSVMMAKKAGGRLSRLLVAVLIITMVPIIGTMNSEPVSAATVLQNDSLAVQIGNIGQIEVFNIRNNRNNKLNPSTQPNFVMPNNESNLNTNTHQYMGELIFSTRAAETKEALDAKAYAEQDVNKTLAAAPAGAMTQYSNFTEANLAANPNINIDYGDSKVTVDYKGFGLNTNAARTMKGYDVRQEWDMNTPDDSLLRTITVKNVSDQYIEFGDMGMPMPWNNKYNGSLYNERMMVHNFAGADSGYTQIIRPSGEGNYLMFAPVPDSGARLEYVEYVQSRADFQGVTGYRANSVYGGLGGDDGGWQPGLNILYQHAKNVYAGNGGAYMPVSTFTSKVLAPGEEMSYQYKYFAVRAGDNSPQESASSPNNASDDEGEREANMRSILYKNGMMDMLAVPSFSTFLNMSTKLDLHYDDSRISDVQVEIMCVHENDPYDTAHIPNNGTPYNVNNSRGGPGLHNAPENAAYSRSVSTPKRTVDARGESHFVYDLSFDCIGNNSVGVSYKLNGVQKYTECEFSVMPEIKSVIDSHANFNYGNRVTTGTYTGQYLESTMHGANSSNTASADDWGWDQGNFMAMKNLLRPNQDEITSLESLHIDLYWGKPAGAGTAPLINHSTYAVANAFSGTGSRTFTHQMAATSFFTMYQIMKAYPDLKYRTPGAAGEGTARWYLNIAYNIYNQRVVTSTSVGYYGEQFIEPLIKALRTEGMTTEANTLQARFTGASSGKGYSMATTDYPYGSEFAFDNTGEEGAYFSAKALRTYAPDHAVYDRAYQNMMLAEWKTRACRGLQPTWFHYGNVVFLGGEGWWNSQYTTPLAAAITDDYLRFQNNGYDNDERAWAERINYAAKLSAFSHVNMGQIASTGIGNISWRYTAFKGRFGAMNVNDQNGNRIQYNGWNDFSGEADENLYGSLLRLSSDVVTDPIFGLYGYGCEVTEKGTTYQIKPLDGIGKKINLLNEKIYLDFSRDEVSSALVAKNGKYMSFDLSNQTGSDHETQLSLTGLPEDGKYYVVKDGTAEPMSEFTVEDGKGVGTIEMSEDDAKLDFAVIFAADYNEEGPTVMAEVASAHTYKDVPIQLSGTVFNANSYVWSVEDAPVGADCSFSDEAVLDPEFTTDTSGDYTIRLTAVDSEAREEYVDVKFEVLDRDDFPAPSIKKASIVTGKMFPTYAYQLTGEAETGIPGGGLTYKWSGPAGVVFSDTNAASPTATFASTGSYTLKLAVTDDIGRTVSKTLRATVLNISESDPPQITTATIATGKKFPGYDYQLVGKATTGIPYGGIVYSWSGPDDAVFSNPAAASPTVSFDKVGEYELTLTVTDDIGRTDSEKVAVSILDLSEANPPEITSARIDADAPIVNTAYGMVGIATTGIPGSDALSYKWSVFPSGGVTFSGTGADSAFPAVTFSIPRTYEFTFTVTDKIGRTDSKKFNVAVAENLEPYNVALSTKGTTLQNIHQNGGARTAPLNGGSVARAAASTLNTWGTSASASRHWFQLTFPDPVTLYGVDIMWSSDGGGTNAPNAGTNDATRNVLLVPAVNPAVPVANDALTWTAANWTRLPMQDKAGTAILDIPRVTNGTAANNVWNFAGFEPVDTQYLLMDLNRPGSGNGVGVNYWRAYALEPIRAADDVYVRVSGNELEDADRLAAVFPAKYNTDMKKIDFASDKYDYLKGDIALKWTPAAITAAQDAAPGVETVVKGTNNTLGYTLNVHVVKGESAPTVIDYVPVVVMAEKGDTVSLPETVTANLDDASKQTLAVTWDVPAGISDTTGSKSVIGTVVLPAGWSGPTTVTATVDIVESARAYLLGRLQAFELLSADDYEQDSYEAALAVYNDAKRVYDYAEALPAEITQAANDLNAAIEGLSKDASAELLAIFEEMLNGFIADYESVKDSATAESLAVFKAAIDAAQAIVDEPDGVSEAAVYAAMDALIEAHDNIEFKANKATLEFFIEEAKKIDVDKLITAAKQNLLAKLAAAEAVYNDDTATQEEVNAAAEDLSAAITESGLLKGNSAKLNALVTIVKGISGTTYTEASFTAFDDARTVARTMLEKVDDYTQSKFDKAYDDLYAAYRGLAKLANFAALQSAINVAQGIVDNIDDYVPASVEGFADELAAAKTVLANKNASQSQVNAASSSLTAKTLLARLKEDKSKLTSAYKTAGKVNKALYTKSSLAAMSVVMDAAKTVLDAPVGEYTQAQVDKVTQRVEDAVKALVKVGADATDDKNSAADSSKDGADSGNGGDGKAALKPAAATSDDEKIAITPVAPVAATSGDEKDITIPDAVGAAKIGIDTQAVAQASTPIVASGDVAAIASSGIPLAQGDGLTAVSGVDAAIDDGATDDGRIAVILGLLIVAAICLLLFLRRRGKGQAE